MNRIIAIVLSAAAIACVMLTNCGESKPPPKTLPATSNASSPPPDDLAMQEDRADGHVQATGASADGYQSRTPIKLQLATTPALDDAPVLFVWHSGDMRSDLEFAVWDDGYVLILDQESGFLRNGHIDKSRVFYFLVSLDQKGFFELSQASCNYPPDAATDTIAARSDQKSNYLSFELHQMTGGQKAAQSTRESPACFQNWAHVRHFIAGISFKDFGWISSNAAATETRGYVLDAPWKTRWRDFRLWIGD